MSEKLNYSKIVRTELIETHRKMYNKTQRTLITYMR